MPDMRSAPSSSGADAIGVFDSGLGGLSVLRELTGALPEERYLYFADNLHVPYGPRPLAEVRGFCEKIARRFIAVPCKLIVVACNTASAASLKHLRNVFPGTPFVGMEPAVKPAAANSVSRKVGVLATQATFQGELFESVVERFAKGTEVIRRACPGLAEFIESHPPDHPGLRPVLEGFIHPLLDAGIDQLVLACTHYSLVKPAIREVAGPDVEVVDPCPAVARRVVRIVADMGAPAKGGGEAVFLASGDAEAFSRNASRVLGRPVRAREARFSV